MKTLSDLITLFHNTCIVWSKLLPRLQWWNSENIEVMENIPARTNHAIIKHNTKWWQGHETPRF